MAIKKEMLPTLPDFCKLVPFQIKGVAVRDACEAVKEAKLKFSKGAGFHSVSFRSRHDVRQSVFIPATAVKQSGIYHSISGKGLRYSEPLPEARDSRLVCEHGRWYLCVPVEQINIRAENQGRVVALDPGIRTFQTFYSETHVGQIGNGDFSRIQRLAHHLDDLLSRLDPKRKVGRVSARKRKSMRLAANRLRCRIRDLVDEMHWKACRVLVDNFDVILLPTFETKQMSSRATRKIRAKSVRAMLTFAHYRFSQRLEQKAAESGKVVIRVCEAYTSKTASWTGEIVKIGGAKRIKSGGISVERDVNGARGIFLRALVDHPEICPNG